MQSKSFFSPVIILFAKISKARLHAIFLFETVSLVLDIILSSSGTTPINSIFKKIAVLIDGPYIQQLDYGVDNLRGSLNQRIIYFNEQFKERYIAYNKAKREMQEINLDNYLLAIGIPNKEYVNNFNKK